MERSRKKNHRSATREHVVVTDACHKWAQIYNWVERLMGLCVKSIGRPSRLSTLPSPIQNGKQVNDEPLLLSIPFARDKWRDARLQYTDYYFFFARSNEI